MRIGLSGAAVVAGLLLTSVSGAQAPTTSAVPAPADVNPVVLKVNGDPVYSSDINLGMQSAQMQARQRGHQLTEDQAMKLATDRAVDQKLLIQEARRNKIQVNEKRVEQTLQGLEQRAGGQDKLAALLKQNGTTLQRYEQVIREQELINDFIESHIKPKVQVTADQVKKFYDDNPTFFKKPEEVRARHILFKVPKDASDAQKKLVLAKAEAARKRALNGEDFATLAKQLSEGPSAPNGGELGFFDRTKMVKPFADAAFALKPGEISPVVETQFGYHVIKVEEHRPPHTQPLEEVKVPIQNFLTQKEVGQQVNQLLSELRKSAHIEQVQPPGAPAKPSDVKK